MVTRRLLLITLFIFLAYPSPAESRVGYIDTGKVIQSCSGYVSLRTRLEKKAKHYQDSLAVLGRRFEAFSNSIRGDYTFTKQMRDSLNRQLVNLQNQIETYLQFAQEAIAREKEIVDEQIGNMLLTDMTRFSKSRGVAVLLKGHPLFYCVGCTDYTADFVDFLRTRSR